RLRVVSLAERLPHRSGKVSTIDAATAQAAMTGGKVSGGTPATVPPRQIVSPDGVLRLCVIGASTGGPPALQQIAQALPRPVDLPIAILVGLHMPAKFTHAFAERIGRTSAWPFREAQSGDALTP